MMMYAPLEADDAATVQAVLGSNLPATGSYMVPPDEAAWMVGPSAVIDYVAAGGAPSMPMAMGMGYVHFLLSALLFGYGLLGAGWLVLKTEGDLQDWARRLGRWCLLGVVAAIGAVSLWTPLMRAEIAARWFSWPNIAFLAPIPLVTAYAAYRLFRDLEEGRHYRPFFLAIGLFLLGYLGLGVSLFPYNVPPNLTIWDTANTVNSQLFALVGFAVVLPMTFAYTAYAYYVFRGKVAEEIDGGGYGYH